jgi:hypothetical protein
LVCGIIGTLCSGVLILGVLAIVLGVLARREIDQSGGRLTGRGMATAGFVLGIVSVVFFVLYIAVRLTN